VARALLGLVILAVFVFGVFPTGSYVDQRNELDRAVDELDALERENEKLESRVERLESDEEIERVARNEFDMVLPSEESYLILPPGS
jgi:cell division protein FtsL